MSNPVILGITGLPGSGKGEFINFVRDFAKSQKICFHCYSLSDVLRAEAKRRGKAIERDILNLIGNELRQKFGNGALSNMILPQLTLDVKIASSRPSVFIVDSIRTPEEIEIFRDSFGNAFMMIAILASPSVLISRIQSRARYDESKSATSNENEAANLLQRELGNGQPSFGLNVSTAIKDADYEFKNVGSLEEFKEKVVQFLKQKLSLTL